MATRRTKNATQAHAPKASSQKSPTPKGKAARAAPAGQARLADPRVAEVERLIDLMVARGAVEVELEDGAHKVRVRLREDKAAGVVHYTHAPHSLGASMAHSVAGAPASAAAPVAEGDVFLSPMVGTFYRSPSPDAEPFAEVGDRIKAEGPLCIIEAMKVMNEIKAEFAAEVVALLVENGQTVEFGQPLFRLKRL